MTSAPSVARLLKQFVETFPQRRTAVLAELSKFGLPADEYELQVEPAKPVTVIPTFDKTKSRPLSPMMAARYAFAAAVREGDRIWPSVTALPAVLRKKDVRAVHQSMREHWDGSAPQQFADDQLSLFQVYAGVPDSIVYLVWMRDEPELWSYHGMASRKFRNLAAFLRWKLK